jgi:hypothetical protein
MSNPKQIYLEPLTPYMGLMNDTLRNQFYHQSLTEITGKRCLEIGFGPGLLSFIALRHHPKHIVAFEQNLQVYELGKYLIKKSGVEDRITLLNDRVDLSFINPADFDVVYHEVVSNGLWDEGPGVFSYLNTSVPFIPSSYVCDFYACEISHDEFTNLQKRRTIQPNNGQFQNWYNSIKDPSWPDVFELDDFDLLSDNIRAECIKKFYFVKENFEFNLEIPTFVPGVDVNTDYINAIQDILAVENLKSDATIINKIPIDEKKYLGRSKKVLSVEVNQHSKKVSVTDHNNKTTTTSIDFTKNFIDMTIDRAALPETSLIIPIFSMKHRDHKLILSEGHWNQCGDNAIVKPSTNNVTVRQHLNANGIEYF